MTSSNLRSAAITGITALCLSAAPAFSQTTSPTTGAGSTTGTATPNGTGSNNGATTSPNGTGAQTGAGTSNGDGGAGATSSQTGAGAGTGAGTSTNSGAGAAATQGGTSSGANSTGTSGMSSGATSSAGTGSSGMASGTSTGFTEGDKTFIADSAEGSMTEIRLSQMALKKSKNDEVKSYAQKMIDDHTKLIADMKPFADQAGVQPPTKLKPAHQQEAARLRAMSGNKFDKEYITAMVADHHKDVADFQNEVSTAQNPDFKSTVSQGLQVVKMHTDMIDSIAQKNNIATPSIPSPAM